MPSDTGNSFLWHKCVHGICLTFCIQTCVSDTGKNKYFHFYFLMYITRHNRYNTWVTPTSSQSDNFLIYFSHKTVDFVLLTTVFWIIISKISVAIYRQALVVFHIVQSLLGKNKCWFILVCLRITTYMILKVHLRVLERNVEKHRPFSSLFRTYQIVNKNYNNYHFPELSF